MEKKMLCPVQGNVRNVAYIPCYDPHSSLPFEEVHIEERDGQKYICISYKNQFYSEHLTEGDLQSLVQEELTTDDLAYKYFAYLMML